MIIHVISDDYRLQDLGDEYPYHAREPDRKFMFGYEGVEKGRTRINGRELGVEYRFFRAANIPHHVREQAESNNDQLIRHPLVPLFSLSLSLRRSL